jgi:hypothetical protein
MTLAQTKMRADAVAATSAREMTVMMLPTASVSVTQRQEIPKKIQARCQTTFQTS